MTALPVAAVFRTAAHSTFVYLRVEGADQYSAHCDGCDWSIGSDKMPRFSDDSHMLTLPVDERRLRLAEDVAEKHAAHCRKLPENQWPTRAFPTARGAS